MTSPRQRRRSIGGHGDVPVELAKYISSCGSADGARKALRFGLDEFKIERGDFGNPLALYQAALEHWDCDQHFAGKMRSQIEELEAAKR